MFHLFVSHLTRIRESSYQTLVTKLTRVRLVIGISKKEQNIVSVSFKTILGAEYNLGVSKIKYLSVNPGAQDIVYQFGVII